MTVGLDFSGRDSRVVTRVICDVFHMFHFYVPCVPCILCVPCIVFTAQDQGIQDSAFWIWPDLRFFHGPGWLERSFCAA